MLWDLIESELEDKIRRLEEDRNNVDVTSQVWAEQNLHRKRRRHRQVSTNVCACTRVFDSSLLYFELRIHSVVIIVVIF